MSALDRFADACLRSAARRWSDDTMLAEWRAELAHLPRRGATYRRLAYAVSLACSPPPESAAGPWPVRLGPPTRAVLGWATVALLAATLAGAAQDPLRDVVGLPYPVAGPLGIALSVATMAWIGSRARVAAVGPMVLVLGLVTLFAASSTDPYAPRGEVSLRGVLAVAAWALLTGVATGAAGRLARRGRRAAAWLAGTAGALVAVDAGVAVLVSPTASQQGYGLLEAPLWAGYSLVPGLLPAFDGRMLPTEVRVGDSLVSFSKPMPAVTWIGDEGGQLARPLLYCGVFVLVAMIVVARRAVGSVVAGPVVAGPVVGGPVLGGSVVGGSGWTESPGTDRGRWRGAAVAGALVAFAVGAGTWAYLCGLVPPSYMPSGRAFDYDSLGGYRLVAVLTVTLALAALLALARRGPVAVPAVAAFAVLLAVECTFDRAGVHSPATAVAVTLAVGAGAVALSGRLPSARSDAREPSARPDTSARAALAFVAVAATMAVPTGLDIFPELPIGVMVTEFVTAAALWVLAALAALASRTAPIRPSARVALILGGLAAVMAAVPDDLVRRLYWPDSALFVQAPLTVLLIAVIRAPGTRRARWRWCAVGVAATLASAVVSRGLRVPMELLQWLLAQGMGPAPLYEPGGGGVILLGVVVAGLVARPPAAPPAAPDPVAAPVRGVAI